jgi:NADH-quinone oxidoreductase subunit N
LAWVPKAVGFLSILRALSTVLASKEAGDPLVSEAAMLSWVIAAATMIWGNFVALLQDNLKRLLAYSSIAHAGYMMVGVTASFSNDSHGGAIYYGAESILFYLSAYALMTLGAFAAFSALRVGGQVVETVDDLAGLGSTHPGSALALAVCLLSLSGIPPLMGFWAKFQVFSALLAAGERADSASFIALAIIGMLSAAAGAYVYLRIVVVMYFRPSKSNVERGGGWPVTAAVATCAGLTVILGVFSSPISDAAHAAARAAVEHPLPTHVQVVDAASVPSPLRRALPNHGEAPSLTGPADVVARRW